MATDISLCHLTTKDHLILEGMIEHRIEHGRQSDAVFEQMLQRKARNSQLYLRDDIPADVATLDRWVVYQINGRKRGPSLLVSQSDASSDDALSIHTLYGLALLGMAEGATVSIETENGQTESLVLVKVVQAPAQPGKLARTVVEPRPSGDVVVFRARKVPPRNHAWHPDDDPGPSAA